MPSETASDTSPQPRLGLLLEVQDRPGALLDLLRPFDRLGINLTHLESRPAAGERFDFYLDCEGARGDAAIEQLLQELRTQCLKVLVLDERSVPWFPRHIRELDCIANRTLDAGTDLQADHPGFHDLAYRQRRSAIDGLARQYRHGDTLPVVTYKECELGTWRQVFQQLSQLHPCCACDTYRHIFSAMQHAKLFTDDHIPTLQAVSEYLSARTGFRLRPVAGLLGPRQFLNALAFRVFFCTQYVRHHSRPLYTPEPDICHEMLGHVPMFADPDFAQLSELIGLASLGASDADIEKLARCYWYSVEFGLLRERGELRAYGAGLLSSYGELAYACGLDSERAAPQYRPWQPAQASALAFPITDYQPCYFVAESLLEASMAMQDFCEQLPRPFYARYNRFTEAVWVDRAVRAGAA